MKVRIEIALEVESREQAALLTEAAADAARAAAQTTDAVVTLATWTLRRDRKRAA